MARLAVRQEVKVLIQFQVRARVKISFMIAIRPGSSLRMSDELALSFL